MHLCFLLGRWLKIKRNPCASLWRRLLLHINPIKKKRWGWGRREIIMLPLRPSSRTQWLAWCGHLLTPGSLPITHVAFLQPCWEAERPHCSLVASLTWNRFCVVAELSCDGVLFSQRESLLESVISCIYTIYKQTPPHDRACVESELLYCYWPNTWSYRLSPN